jgi:hypothetical protein
LRRGLRGIFSTAHGAETLPDNETLVLLHGFENESPSAFVEHVDHRSILSAAGAKDSMSISAVEKLKRLSKNPDSRLISYPEQAHGIGLFETNLAASVVKFHQENQWIANIICCFTQR